MWYALLTGLVFYLAQAVGSLVGRVLVALGVGYVTYTGFSSATDWIMSQMQSNLSALPVDIANFLGYLWVDKAVTTLFSAYTAALAVKLAGGTSVTKRIIKKT